MADLALLKKLGVRPGTGLTILGLPDDLKDKLTIEYTEPSTTLLFAISTEEVAKTLPELIDSLPEAAPLWIAFPKKSSTIHTNLNRDILWQMITDAGFNTLVLIAVDNNWSAFKVGRTPRKTEAVRRDPELPRPELVVPKELAARLADSPAASENFNKLSYSCRKEYIVWIDDAKRNETRQKRVEQTVERLMNGKSLH